MSEFEPIRLSPQHAGGNKSSSLGARLRDIAQTTTFTRDELMTILAVYGRKVASGEWRDYALDMGRDRAVFAIFRRSCECPLYRIEKVPRLARRQGPYSVVAASGLIMKRGADLRRVLSVLDQPRIIAR